MCTTSRPSCALNSTTRSLLAPARAVVCYPTYFFFAHGRIASIWAILSPIGSSADDSMTALCTVWDSTVRFRVSKGFAINVKDLMSENYFCSLGFMVKFYHFQLPFDSQYRNLG